MRWVPILLGASILLLAAGIMWSVWRLRLHVVRRQEAEHALHEAYAFRRAMEDSLLTGLRARHGRPHDLYEPGVLPHGRLLRVRTARTQATDALLGPG